MRDDLVATVAGWLKQVAEPQVGGAALRLLRMDGEAEATEAPAGVVVEMCADAAQALVQADGAAFDLVVTGESASEAGVTMVLPVTGGRLPEGLPIALIVARDAVGEASRGVVSKFARPSGGGRGKARRRSVRS